MSQDVEKHIYRILSGKLLFSCGGKNYTLFFPKPSLKYKANLIYESIINDEKYNEWIRSENLDKYMRYLGVWDNQLAIFMKNSEKEIENLKVSLFNNRLNSKLTDRTRGQLNNLRLRVNELAALKHSYYKQTLEGYADSIKQEYIIINTVYHKGKKVFDRFKSRSNALHIFNNILEEIDQQSLSDSDYRKMAKSDLWRSFWNVGKQKIFKSPVSEWTSEQLSLVSYTMMYDSVYEHPEKPPENVINDDDMLDGWMITQRRNMEKNQKQDQILKGSSKLGKAQEVFIFTDSEDGVKEIMSMNSDEAILDIKQREYTIGKNDTIEQSKLPDIQKDLINRT